MGRTDIDSKKKGTQGGTDDSPELEYHILVISKKDTFIAMTLQKNLKDNGFEVSHSVPNVQEISEFRDTCNIFIFYMDEGSAVERDTLVYLKDLSMEEEKMVILIGTQDEFRVATWILPKENLAAWFLRPFDMRVFLDKMKELTDAKEREYRKKCILVVDDDISYLKMIDSWLKEKYRVAIVNSGLQAITWLAKNKADLVLLDYEMPVADGPSILEMLKSETGTDSIPVFFLTGRSDWDSIQKVIDLKPERYLLKTIGRQVLLDELDKFFFEQKALSS